MSGKAIISDFGGVLTTPLGNSFAAWSKKSGIPLEDLGATLTHPHTIPSSTGGASTT